MKQYLLMVSAIALTVIAWGVYGPVLHKGQAAMQGSRLRPFICVGLAYFAIAVVVPTVWLWLQPEKGGWSFSGVVWSLSGGAAGAIGALGIILAFYFKGQPSLVMPLVFGCAPVVNAFLTIYWAGTWNKVSPLFLAGLILVAAGAFIVLFFAPKADSHGPASPTTPPTAEATTT